MQGKRHVNRLSTSSHAATNPHGKEGVDGSSPSEGFCTKVLQIGILCCLRWRGLHASRVRDGYILGLAGTRGHARHLGTYATMCSRHSIATRGRKVPAERSLRCP